MAWMKRLTARLFFRDAVQHTVIKLCADQNVQKHGVQHAGSEAG